RGQTCKLVRGTIPGRSPTRNRASSRHLAWVWAYPRASAGPRGAWTSRVRTRSFNSFVGYRGRSSMIPVRGLNVDYQEARAVSGMELDVRAGAVCGLIGPNGAGKTTTMRSIVGLIEPTDGLIEVAGVDMRERPQDARRLVAFMPDFAPLYDDLKVWEFLDLFAASYFIPKSRRADAVDRY